nr:uncharacterized protein BN731_02022 [Ipomoea batatas]GMD70577.1 uncharacterized protein BN731_02022 [Ipomoea batatas]GMD72650.1 uncharacterized protein BN731_02022 [Ipomoea batatas]GMD79607.1 uncharacterized protein BN731_02022 [Ipomoea batatas]
MRCHAPSCCQDPSSSMHAPNIFRTCFSSHLNDTLPLRMPSFSIISTEYNLPYSCPRRCRQPHSNHFVFVSRRETNLRVKKLVKMLRLNHLYCSSNVNKSLFNHVHSNFHRTFSCTLP